MNIYERAIEHWGKERQIEKTIEELCELQIELEKETRGVGDRQAILSEMADVLNTIEYVLIIKGFTQEEVSYARHLKMQRTMERIERECEGE
jgi:phosphoribosyl-ATP pyrophosphohydrolase